ncbi:MAG TPA: hypothetical protein VKA21_16580 [Candidatus Binatia bacterium]|nr:hypothetical protein [Candidatus Binatia bacterium]
MTTRAMLVFLSVLSAPAFGAGIPLLDASGTARGSAVLRLSKGQIQLKIAGLAPLPAAATSGSETFTAHLYKAYLFSSADPAVEIFLADVYPNAKQRASRRIALGGDVSHMAFDRIAVTAFSSDGQKTADVLTASFAP